MFSFLFVYPPKLGFCFFVCRPNTQVFLLCFLCVCVFFQVVCLSLCVFLVFCCVSVCLMPL